MRPGVRGLAKNAIRGILLALFGLVVAVTSVCSGSSQLPTKPQADSQKGASLYNQFCLSCHGGGTGGKITDIPPPHNANGHTWHHPDRQLTDIILNGLSASVDPQKMPAFKDKLSQQDVEEVLAYIKTWWTDKQREFQAAATKQGSDYEKDK